MFWCKGERSWNWVGGEDLVLVSLESIFSTIPADIKWSRHKTNILLGKSFSCLSFCLFFYLSFEIFFFFYFWEKALCHVFFFSLSLICATVNDSYFSGWRERTLNLRKSLCLEWGEVEKMINRQQSGFGREFLGG